MGDGISREMTGEVQHRYSRAGRVGGYVKHCRLGLHGIQASRNCRFRDELTSGEILGWYFSWMSSCAPTISSSNVVKPDRPLAFHGTHEPPLPGMPRGAGSAAWTGVVDEEIWLSLQE